MRQMKVQFSPINSITNTLYKDVFKITVNGGGGIGGTHEVIIGKILERKDMFYIVEELITGDKVQIFTNYIGTIRPINVTKVFFTHSNTNFPSGKRTEWYSHRPDTEIEYVKDGTQLSRGTDREQFDLDLKKIHECNH